MNTLIMYGLIGLLIISIIFVIICHLFEFRIFEEDKKSSYRIIQINNIYYVERLTKNHFKFKWQLVDNGCFVATEFINIESAENFIDYLIKQAQ